MVEKVKPKEITDAVTNNTKKRTVSEASIARPVAKELPEKYGEFTTPIPSLTAAGTQGQTAAKMDKSFKNVFSKLVGEAPRKREKKNPNAV